MTLVWAVSFCSFLSDATDKWDQLGGESEVMYRRHSGPCLYPLYSDVCTCVRRVCYYPTLTDDCQCQVSSQTNESPQTFPVWRHVLFKFSSGHKKSIRRQQRVVVWSVICPGCPVSSSDVLNVPLNMSRSVTITSSVCLPAAATSSPPQLNISLWPLLDNCKGLTHLSDDPFIPLVGVGSTW